MFWMMEVSVYRVIGEIKKSRMGYLVILKNNLVPQLSSNFNIDKIENTILFYGKK